MPAIAIFALVTLLGALTGAVLGLVISPEGAVPIAGGAVIGGLGFVTVEVAYVLLANPTE